MTLKRTQGKTELAFKFGDKAKREISPWAEGIVFNELMVDGSEKDS